MTGKTFQASPSQSHWLNYNWRSLHADKWIVDFSFKKVNFFFFTFCYTIVNLYFFCFWKPKRCILWDYSHWLSSWNMRGKLISLGSFIYSFFFQGLGMKREVCGWPYPEHLASDLNQIQIPTTTCVCEAGGFVWVHYKEAHRTWTQSATVQVQVIAKFQMLISIAKLSRFVHINWKGVTYMFVRQSKKSCLKSHLHALMFLHKKHTFSQ